MDDISPKQWIILTILVAIIAFGTGRIYGFKSGVKQNNFSSIKANSQNFEIRNASSAKDKNDSLLTVYVTGEVKNPDVYKLPQDSIVKDAIQKAGGPNEDADLVAINLARKITDGEEIIVPKKGSSGTEQQGGTSKGTNSGKININTADINTLQKLPGIGEVKANAIIQYRKTNGAFKTIHDITRVSGIGEKTFEKIKDLITVG